MSASKSFNFQAIKYTSASQDFTLKQENITVPQDLAEDDVLIKVAYSTLNPVDLVIYSNTNRITNPFGKEFGIGRELSGTVVATGSKITQLIPGDRVVGLTLSVPEYEGPVAEYFKVKYGRFFFAKVPENLSFDLAASLPLSYMTAYDLVYNHYHITKQSKVLVIGGGTMAGLFTLELLKDIIGVHDLYSIQSTKTDALHKSFGLEVKSINYDTNPNSVAEVESLITNNFAGEKFDVILDTVGNSDILAKAHEILKLNHKSVFLTIVGDFVLDYRAGLFTTVTHFARAALRQIYRRFFSPGYIYKFAWTPRDEDALQAGVNLLADKKLHTVVDSVYTIEHFKDAFGKLETHHAKGKVLIKLDKSLDSPTSKAI